MSLRVVGAATVIAAILASGGRAYAQDAPNWADKSGKVGVGLNTTLGGTDGINVRTWVSSLFGIQGTIGFSFTDATFEPEGGGDESSLSQSVYSVGLYAAYKLAYWQRGSLSVIFGGDIEALSHSFESGGMTADQSETSFLLGTGLAVEYFPTQYLSLFAHTGIRVDFLTDDDVGRAGIDENLNDVSGIDISLGSDLWGAAGFTVWFR